MVRANISEKFAITKPGSTWSNESHWTSWVWQQQNRIRSLAQLSSVLQLTAEESATIQQADLRFKLAITPYYLSLMDAVDPNCPIRRQAVPQKEELVMAKGEMEDPAKEDSMSPVPGIVHRYPDRVLLYTTHHCAVYCRFCTRKRKVSNPDSAMKMDELFEGIDYIAKNPAIREVIVSGGDALSNSDERLYEILNRLRSINHLEIIRIGSRNLVTLPFRVTKELAKLLSEFQPLFFHTHFNHPKECSREALEACAFLSDAGIPINNHTVLLKGINDNIETMRELNLKLLMMRVRPYYLYQCDQVAGNSGFRTSIQSGLDILRGLRGWSSGLAIPQYVVDTSGGGKVPLLPNYIVKATDTETVFENYRGEKFQYPHNEKNNIL